MPEPIYQWRLGNRYNSWTEGYIIYDESTDMSPAYLLKQLKDLKDAKAKIRELRNELIVLQETVKELNNGS